MTDPLTVLTRLVADLAGADPARRIAAADQIREATITCATQCDWPDPVAEMYVACIGRLTRRVADSDASATAALVGALLSPARPIPPERWTPARALDALGSSDLVDRLHGGYLLAMSVGRGMAASGMSELDAEHGAGKDITNLIGIVVSREGDGTAADAAIKTLREALTTDPSQAAATPTEAPSLADLPESVWRHLRTHSPLSALDALASAPPDEREPLVRALFILAGAELSGRVPCAEAREFTGLVDRLRAGDPAAIDAAREWLVAHLFAARPVAGQEEPCHD